MSHHVVRGSHPLPDQLPREHTCRATSSVGAVYLFLQMPFHCHSALTCTFTQDVLITKVVDTNNMNIIKISALSSFCLLAQNQTWNYYLLSTVHMYIFDLVSNLHLVNMNEIRVLYSPPPNVKVT